MVSRQQAWELLCSKMQNQNLRRHCLSVEVVMRALADHFKGDPEKWGIVGLLHDGDYEQTKEKPEDHSKIMAQWVRDLGETDKELLEGIESHGRSHLGVQPVNNMEWSLFCCDELTGLIVATALVQPNKKLSEVTVDSVLKKFKTKGFAAGAKREDIQMCEEKLSIDLPRFIEIALVAMQSVAPELGL